MTRHASTSFRVLALACILAAPLGAAGPVDDIVTLPVPLPVDDVLPAKPPCRFPVSTIIVQGTHDWFVLPVEPATPRWDLNYWMGTVSSSPQRDYDESGINKLFGTTLTGLPPNILGGTVRMHVMPLSGSNYSNDGFGLGFKLVPPTFTFSYGFEAWVGAGNWNANQDVVVSVPLTPALVQKMNADGFLDVYIQDDTVVDEIELELTYCECEVVYSGSRFQGELDAFDTTSQPAPTPETQFNAWMNSGNLGGTRNYDQPGVNRRFGTSFDNLPPHLLSLTVDVHLRGAGELDENDSISLQFHPVGTGAQFSWGSYLVNEIAGWPTEGTVSKAVGALNSGTLLADVNSVNRLDVYVQDDTNVDWIWLNYTYCKCRDARGATYLGGVQDDFDTSNGPEPTSPRPAFAAAQTTYPMRTFDGNFLVDRQFAHSFVNLPSHILDATLEIRMRPAGGQPDTDYIQLQWENNAFVWGMGMNALYGGNWAGAPPTTFVLDLANLPGATPPDAVLASMNANHYLDIYVADDTDVDYVLLTIRYCVCLSVPAPDDVAATLNEVVACSFGSGTVRPCVGTTPGVPDCCPPSPTVSVHEGPGCDASGTALTVSTPAGGAHLEHHLSGGAPASFSQLVDGQHAYVESNGQDGLQCGEEGDARLA